MRGRKPNVLSLTSSDVDRLHHIAHSDHLPGYQVRRARIVLALAAGQRKRDVAAQVECGVATVWRTGDRYRRDDLDGLLADRRGGQSGRLEQVTPCATGANHRIGLFGADCQGLAHHALVERGLGPSSRARRYRWLD